MQVRSRFRCDGARRYEDVEGGLNRMTVGRFEDLIRASRFHLDTLTLVPIRGMTWATRHRLTREALTSIVQAKLLKPAGVAKALVQNDSGCEDIVLQ